MGDDPGNPGTHRTLPHALYSRHGLRGTHRNRRPGRTARNRVSPVRRISSPRGRLAKQPRYNEHARGRAVTGRIEVYSRIRFFKLDSSGSFREAEIIEAIKFIPGFEREARRLLHTIVQRTGLLQADRDRYQFVHRSIWEYFVAEGCRDESYASLVERANARHWEEPLRLFAGLLDEEEFERFVRLLWPRNTGLALRTMSELSQLPEAILGELYAACEDQEKVHIIQELRTIHALTDDPRRKEKLLCDTIGVLLTVENSAEFIYYFIDLLQIPGSAQCNSLIARILDTPNQETRLRQILKTCRLSSALRRDSRK